MHKAFQKKEEDHEYVNTFKQHVYDVEKLSVFVPSLEINYVCKQKEATFGKANAEHVAEYMLAYAMAKGISGKNPVQVVYLEAVAVKGVVPSIFPAQTMSLSLGLLPFKEARNTLKIFYLTEEDSIHDAVLQFLTNIDITGPESTIRHVCKSKGWAGGAPACR